MKENSECRHHFIWRIYRSNVNEHWHICYMRRIAKARCVISFMFSTLIYQKKSLKKKEKKNLGTHCLKSHVDDTDNEGINNGNNKKGC